MFGDFLMEHYADIMKEWFQGKEGASNTYISSTDTSSSITLEDDYLVESPRLGSGSGMKLHLWIRWLHIPTPWWSSTSQQEEGLAPYCSQFLGLISEHHSSMLQCISRGIFAPQGQSMMVGNHQQTRFLRLHVVQTTQLPRATWRIGKHVRYRTYRHACTRGIRADVAFSMCH